MRAAARTAYTAVMIVVLAVAATGCAPSSPAPNETISAQLEETVLAITQAVAAEDWSTADRDLDVLEAQVNTALAAGGLGEERAAEILAAIALVRGDVTAGLEQAEPTESPEPTKTEEPEKSEEPEDSEKPGNRGGNRDKDD